MIDTLTILGILFLIYFMPALLAGHFRHPQTAAIFMLNLLFGWTGIGWGIALIWAFTKEKKPTWR
jgi:hypothetical protein